jgi:hypothetical protein
LGIKEGEKMTAKGIGSILNKIIAKKKTSLNLRTERDGHPGKGGLYKTKWK